MIKEQLDKRKLAVKKVNLSAIIWLSRKKRF